MPPKVCPDENTRFLYTCLQQSDYKHIDFSQVGKVNNISPAAARMRWSRLRKSLDTETLDNAGSNATPATPKAKGKRNGKGKGKGKGKGRLLALEEDEEEPSPQHNTNIVKIEDEAEMKSPDYDAPSPDTGSDCIIYTPEKSQEQDPYADDSSVTLDFLSEPEESSLNKIKGRAVGKEDEEGAGETKRRKLTVNRKLTF